METSRVGTSRSPLERFLAHAVLVPFGRPSRNLCDRLLHSKVERSDAREVTMIPSLSTVRRGSDSWLVLTGD